MNETPESRGGGVVREALIARNYCVFCVYFEALSLRVGFAFRQVNGASVPGAKKENFELEFKVGMR